MGGVLANEAELYFDRGGPVQRFFHRLALRLRVDLTLRGRILGFLVLTWVPLLLFALIEGRALGASPKESLLQDFATYVRFFVAVPLLIIAELVVGPRLRGAGLQFVHGGLVRAKDFPAFDGAIARAAKWRESAWADFIILGVAVIVSWTATIDTVYGEGLATWRSPTRSGGPGVSLTGLWYHLVAVPVLLYFWLRWLCRLLVWGKFLWSVSRLDLALIATHADRAGGLGFLGTAHTSLGIFAFCLSAVLSAEAAFLIVFEQVDIETFKVPYAALLVVAELLLLGPLLVFVPILVRTRLAALREYSLLVDRYNRGFHDKWIGGAAPADEPLLGSADIQSLADLGNSFRFIQEMTAYPFSVRAILQLALVTSLPCLPLLLLVMPVGQIIELLAKAVA
ncbi:hypothetical protein [Urbifossiella limnaea]|uniref:Uncharacterized protein n=1 Tax=Urbifossiella limnaea TaxID=2528023 RepID=A0A517XT08_9BACT|nr:hypothetical protein [Urbifossiella limnaea]QDU20670.1 hypothetical protein ETAA1_26270 [Urbifossiella limnaea]